MCVCVCTSGGGSVAAATATATSTVVGPFIENKSNFRSKIFTQLENVNIIT